LPCLADKISSSKLAFNLLEKEIKGRKRKNFSPLDLDLSGIKPSTEVIKGDRKCIIKNFKGIK